MHHVVFVEFHELGGPRGRMHLTQVNDHVLVHDPVEQENFLHRIRCLLFDKGLTVSLISEEHKAFHLTDIFHDLVLLHEVAPHPLLDHVSSGHVAAHGSL